MKEDYLVNLLKQVKSGEMDIPGAVNALKHYSVDDIGYAKIDYHRELRKGYPEVIYCEGKTLEHIGGIFKKMDEKKSNILATRASKEVFEYIKKDFINARYYSEAGIIYIENQSITQNPNEILVVTAGTSDISVAEEAAITAEKLGNRVNRLYDVGVAGLHRLLDNTEKLYGASVIIVVAGMEGALPSVVGGLVDVPVIAVPTSVGYGTNFGGLTALFSMLNSCSSGIGVVNIDNGFGAGYLASVINKGVNKKA